MANWWEAPVTQAHGVNGEQGVDVGTPFHSIITDILGGKVVGTNYGGYGAEVDVLTPGGQTESFVHLDDISVANGQDLRPGDQLGLSGGQLGYGDHPAVQPYSNGPHVEYDIWTGTPWSSTPLDPTATLQAGPAGGAQLLADRVGPLGGRGQGRDPRISGQVAPSPATDAAAALSGLGGAGAAISASIAGIPASIGHGLANALTIGLDDAALFMKRQIVALAVAAVVLLILFA